MSLLRGNNWFSKSHDSKKEHGLSRQDRGQENHGTFIVRVSVIHGDVLCLPMAAASGCTKACAGKALNGTIEAITKAVKKGDKVALVGFGTFSPSKRKARMGRNPRTAASIKIAAKKLPKFSAGKLFKGAPFFLFCNTESLL